jgi:hypothetical protein
LDADLVQIGIHRAKMRVRALRDMPVADRQLDDTDRAGLAEAQPVCSVELAAIPELGRPEMLLEDVRPVVRARRRRFSVGLKHDAHPGPP